MVDVFSLISDSVLEESLPDKVLRRCEIIKRAVHDLAHVVREAEKDNNKSKCDHREKIQF